MVAIKSPPLERANAHVQIRPIAFVGTAVNLMTKTRPKWGLERQIQPTGIPLPSGANGFLQKPDRREPLAWILHECTRLWRRARASAKLACKYQPQLGLEATIRLNLD
jgi:hypothetical protein